jgi:CBS domain containing-hemolysin-like protein
LLLGILMLLSAFFSGAEVAMFSADRLLLRTLARQGRRAAHHATALIRRPEWLLGIVLVGNNLVNTSIATLSDSLVARTVPAGLESLANALVATPAILLLGEFLPKALARAHADRLALAAALPLRLAGGLLWPLVAAVSALGQRLASLVASRRQTAGAAAHAEPPSIHEELSLLAEMATEQGTLPRHTGRMLQRFFAVEKRPVAELLHGVARPPLLPATATLADVEQAAAASGATQFPVWEGAPERIIGMVTLPELLYAAGTAAAPGLPIRPYVNRELLEIAAREPFGSLLQQLHYRKNPAILLRAADGSVRGIVSLPDLFDAMLQQALPTHPPHPTPTGGAPEER